MAQEQKNERPSNDEIEKLASKAFNTLREHADNIFYRSGQLVDVMVFADGQIRERQMSKSLLASHLRKFFGWSDKNLNLAASHILNHERLESFNVLDSISSVPILRPDFSLVPPGYDKATSVLFKPSDAFSNHHFNLNATPAEAKKAYQKLMYVFSDFPVMGDGKVNAVAFILSLVTRSATDFVVPILAIKANGQSNGKSLLAKVISWCAQGKTIKDILADKMGTAEVDKTIRAQLVAHQKLIHIDNIVNRFDSTLLTAVATSKDPSIRMFGTLSLPAINSDALFILNGNDLKVSSDIGKRLIFLEMWHEDPASRDPRRFRVYLDHGLELEAYLEQSWLEYYDAAMTIVQAWRNAGNPMRKPHSPLDKYSGWESTIGGMIEFCGERNFLHDHAQRMFAADEEKQEFVAFLEMICEKFPESLLPYKGVGMDALVHMLLGDWKKVLPTVNGSSVGSMRISLGKFLGAKEGVFINGYRITRKHTAQGNTLVIHRPDEGVVTRA